MIKKYDEVNHTGLTISEYKSGTELLDAISRGKETDIIFLDINMDDIDGLSVAKRIREIDDDVPIILVTAFMNYALDGYKVRASIFHTKKEVLLLKAFGSETQSTRIYNLGGQSLRVVPEY